MDRAWLERQSKKYEQLCVTNRKRQMPMLLSFGQWVRLLREPCRYCGSMRPEDGNGAWADRLDNARGYEPENTVPCCPQCNMMKFNYTEERFLSQCRKVARHRERTEQTDGRARLDDGGMHARGDRRDRDVGGEAGAEDEAVAHEPPHNEEEDRPI